MPEVIDIESKTEQAAPPNQTMAVARIESGAVGRALSVQEIHASLECIRRVMKEEMRDGQDYGTIPGTGEKPSLLLPGAQKLLLTFQLREQVKREVLRDLPHPSIPGHREYEFTITVFPAGASMRDGWDGVGTCSTMEGKYRFRKAERRCPECGKEKIIQGKAEFGGGWICFKKKGGCGAKFAENDARITAQIAETVEHDNPPDYWNTVRKMAFKRALVAAAINATNTSELWTQDIEDMGENDRSRPKTASTPPKNAPGAPGGARPPSTGTPPAQSSRATPPASKAPPPNKTPDAPKYATEASRAYMIRQLHDCLDLATEYFRKLENPSVILPNETLEDIPLQFVPLKMSQIAALKERITDFGNGAEAEHAFPPNPRPEDPKPPAKAKAAVPPPAEPPAKQPLPPSVEHAKRNPDWFWVVICPIPRRGQKKADYDRAPETILSMYTAMKSGDEDASKRLWGFAKQWDPQPRTVGDKTYPVTEAERTFREALDAFLAWEEKHGRDTKGTPVSPKPEKEFLEKPAG